MAGSAVQCALAFAIMSVAGSLDKARFTCLYRAIYVRFSLKLYIVRFAEYAISSVFLN